MYGDLATIRAVLTEVQGGRQQGEMVLVHGQCNPRHPASKRPIPWTVAKRLRRVEQSYLRGADWLCEWVAVELGWGIEPRLADWDRHKNRAAFVRNAEMVADGANRCDGFVLPCRDPACDRPEPHGTHGSSHCLDLAERAGIRTERHLG